MTNESKISNENITNPKSKHFLDYSNKTQSNIIPQDEFQNLIEEVFNVLADNLCLSLGPLGSSAMILEGMTTSSTKDGYAILKSYRFHNIYKKMIYNLIKAPCTRMNNTVGDGTTTAIALTSELFSEYNKHKDYINTLYRMPREFIRRWDNIISYIVDEIESHATHIDPNDYESIYNIAYVTSNGNAEISQNIAETYMSCGTPAIRQKDSPTTESYIEAIDGFDFPTHLIGDTYVRNEDMSAIEEDVAVMIFNHRITSDILQKLLIPINEAMRAMHHKFIVVAPTYDALMADTVLEQYVRMEMQRYGVCNLIPTQYNAAKLNKWQLRDLAVILKTKFITQDITDMIIEEITKNGVDNVIEDMINNSNSTMYKKIGSADSVMLTCTAGSIFKVHDIKDDPTYQETLNLAKKELEEIKGQISEERQSYAAKIYEANSRVLQLEMKNYIYYVGANSNLQKNITWDSIEDVIKCTRSATKYGVVPGCQLTIAKIATSMLENIAASNNTTIEEVMEKGIDATIKHDDALDYEIISMIYRAVIRVYSRVLFGPNNDGILKMIPRWQYTSKEGFQALSDEVNKKYLEIVENSLSKNQVFDLETMDYSDKIITSAETDMMVLTAASDVVKILISGNQCVFLDAQLDEVHQEDVTPKDVKF